MVDLLRALDIEYAAFNPGASFRGIHDSLLNYGDNRSPQIITCCHEEISVAVAHGYGRAAGRPMTAILHNLVGLQHATMAIFNAWCDRVPMLLLGGTGPMDAAQRRPWIDWIHTALVQGNLVRDFVKWDDQPAGIHSMADSFYRAHRLTVTEPTAPVYVCLDAALQEMELGADDLPALPDPERFCPPAPPQADATALNRLARWLLAAEMPLIVADRAGRRPETVDALVELAEFLGAPVIDQWNRFNFPSTHPLDLTGAERDLLPQADVVLALDVLDLYGTLMAAGRSKTRGPAAAVLRAGARVAHISLADYLVRSWATDYQRLPEVDLPIAAETAVALPALLQVCRAELLADGDLAAGFAARKAARQAPLAERRAALREKWDAAARRAEAEEPVAVPTLAREVFAAIKGEDWVLANGDLKGWARRLWAFDRPYRWQGGKHGGGLGYGVGVSLGVALANRGKDRLVVDLQPDGDLLFTPSALWTAAHHRIPVLFVLYNNRSYYNAEEHALTTARARQRPLERTGIGTRIQDPDVDFVGLARSFGLHAEGPVTSATGIRVAVDRALQVVRGEGRAALVDVRCQPR